MVKFNQKLLANAVPEWSDQYMDYALLKRQIKEAARAAERRARPRPGAGALADFRTSLLHGQRAPAMDGFAPDDFYVSALAECEKVERFYRLRMRHASEEWAVHSARLRAFAPAEAEPVARSGSESDTPPLPDDKGGAALPDAAAFADDEARERAQSAVRELYRGLTQLRNFCIVNYTAFYKITKKFAKALAPIGGSGGGDGGGGGGAEEVVEAVMRRVHECGFAGRERGSGFAELEGLTDQIERAHAVSRRGTLPCCRAPCLRLSRSALEARIEHGA